MKKPSCVVDSYALMAYLGDEAGAEQVKALLRKAKDDKAIVYLSLINLEEKDAAVVTGDPEFKKVEYLVQVVWL